MEIAPVTAAETSVDEKAPFSPMFDIEYQIMESSGTKKFTVRSKNGGVCRAANIL